MDRYHMARMPLAGAETCAASRLVAKGRESAAAILQAALGEQLRATSTTTHPSGAVQDLAEQILRCFDRALAALRGGRGASATESASGGKRKAEHGPGPATTPVMSSKRIRASGGEETGIRVEKKCSSTEDGFMWRKYGQKDIRGSRYPRVYLRCTYRHDRGCMAKRQVQQSEADPSRYIITYFGEHTCGRDGRAVDDDEDGLDESQAAAFVINFGSGGADRQRGGGGDGIAGEASQVWNLKPKREELQAECSKVGSTLAPVLEHFDGSLGRELGESSFDIGEFISFDDLDLFL